MLHMHVLQHRSHPSARERERTPLGWLPTTHQPRCLGAGAGHSRSSARNPPTPQRSLVKQWELHDTPNRWGRSSCYHSLAAYLCDLSLFFYPLPRRPDPARHKIVGQNSQLLNAVYRNRLTSLPHPSKKNPPCVHKVGSHGNSCRVYFRVWRLFLSPALPTLFFSCKSVSSGLIFYSYACFVSPPTCDEFLSCLYFSV